MYYLQLLALLEFHQKLNLVLSRFDVSPSNKTCLFDAKGITSEAFESNIFDEASYFIQSF